MIFTGQENIDDVIFFPLMRPSVSSFNAEVYGIEERTLGPVEDLTLTFEQLAEVCGGGGLTPVRDGLVVRPRVKVWPSKDPSAPRRLTGFVDVEGVFANGSLRISGYSIQVSGPVAEREEMLRLGHQAEKALVSAFAPLRPGVHARVAMPADNA